MVNTEEVRTLVTQGKKRGPTNYCSRDGGVDMTQPTPTTSVAHQRHLASDKSAVHSSNAFRGVLWLRDTVREQDR